MPIETPEEFPEWLSKQPPETCILIAFRAALRVFLIAIHTSKTALENERVALLIARALLIAGVASLTNSHVVRTAARAAENVADQGADAAHEAGMATVSAVTAAYSVSSSRTAEAKYAVEYSINATFNVTQPESNATKETFSQVTRSAAYADAEMPFASLIKTPVWHDPEEPDWLAAYLKSSIRLLESGPNWLFWREWYQGFVDGNPMDWELQRRVALIDDAIWEAGPEAVAAEIERRRLLMRTAVAPGLVRDAEADVFTFERDDLLALDVLEFACDRILSALLNALDASGSNGFREDSLETITIRRALENHYDEASMLATGFYDACLSLQTNIGDRYPEDTALLNLQNALYAVVEEINEQHPKARERCARLASLKLAEPVTATDKMEISKIPEKLGNELAEAPKAIVQSDVENILSQDNPPKNVRARFTNWITTISQWMDKAMKGDKPAQWLAGVVRRLVRWWSDSDGDSAT